MFTDVGMFRHKIIVVWVDALNSIDTVVENFSECCGIVTRAE